MSPLLVRGRNEDDAKSSAVMTKYMLKRCAFQWNMNRTLDTVKILGVIKFRTFASRSWRRLGVVCSRSFQIRSHSWPEWHRMRRCNRCTSQIRTLYRHPSSYPAAQERTYKISFVSWEQKIAPLSRENEFKDYLNVNFGYCAEWAKKTIELDLRGIGTDVVDEKSMSRLCRRDIGS